MYSAEKICNILESIGYVRTQQGLEKLVLFPWQKEFVKNELENPQLVILKSRDIGSSTIAVILFTFLSMLDAGDFAIASYKKESAKELYNIAVDFLTNLPEPWNLLGKTKKKDDYHLILANGAHITAFEMSPKVGRSFRTKRLLASELAFWEKPRESWAAITGSGVSAASVVVESTPNENIEGTLFEELYKNSSWKPMTVDYHGNPAHTPEWKLEKLAKFGGDLFRFAQEYECSLDKASGARTILSMMAIHAAMRREIDDKGYYPQMGVDVARFGDDASVIAKGTLIKVHELISLRKNDLVFLSNRVIAEAYSMQKEYGFLPLVKIDAIGIGAGVYDIVQGAGIPCIAVNVGESPSDKWEGERSYKSIYRNLKAELWFELRNKIDEVALPYDEELARELICGYNFDNEGRYKVQAKEEIKAALGRSPDDADAIVLMFANMEVMPTVTAKPRGL